MFGPWYYVLKYAKIKRMKNKKKSLLSRFGLVGVSGVIVLGAILKKQKDENKIIINESGKKEEEEIDEPKNEEEEEEEEVEQRDV